MVHVGFAVPFGAFGGALRCQDIGSRIVARLCCDRGSSGRTCLVAGPPSGDGGPRPRRIADGFGCAYFPRCELTCYVAKLGSAAKVWSGLFGSCCMGYFLPALAMNAAQIEETTRWFSLKFEVRQLSLWQSSVRGLEARPQSWADIAAGRTVDLDEVLSESAVGAAYSGPCGRPPCRS